MSPNLGLISNQTFPSNTCNRTNPTTNCNRVYDSNILMISFQTTFCIGGLSLPSCSVLSLLFSGSWILLEQFLGGIPIISAIIRQIAHQKLFNKKANASTCSPLRSTTMIIGEVLHFPKNTCLKCDGGYLSYNFAGFSINGFADGKSRFFKSCSNIFVQNGIQNYQV